MIDRPEFAAWIDGYERAWRSPGTAGLVELFTEYASYRHAPFAQPINGLDAIAADWEDERDGADEVFTMAAEIVAVEGDTGVARLRVRYGEPVTQEYLDLWGRPVRRRRPLLVVRGVAVLAGSAVGRWRSRRRVMTWLWLGCGHRRHRTDTEGSAQPNGYGLPAMGHPGLQR